MWILMWSAVAFGRTERQCTSVDYPELLYTYSDNGGGPATEHSDSSEWSWEGEVLFRGSSSADPNGRADDWIWEAGWYQVSEDNTRTRYSTFVRFPRAPAALVPLPVNRWISVTCEEVLRFIP